jgi:hypothetical protein
MFGKLSQFIKTTLDFDRSIGEKWDKVWDHVKGSAMCAENTINKA